jgi:ABC-type branched-subunit amino acid transport system substrate-binding protein
VTDGNEIGGGMRRIRTKSRTASVAAFGVAALFGATSVCATGAMAASAATTSNAPLSTSNQTQGITPTTVTVGSISTQSGPIASNFASLIYGELAYFNWINSKGGINGRRIIYKYQLDDGGDPSQFNNLASTLIDQDKVFAVTGVATAFFTPNLFTESGIPTYGYDVTGNWTGPPNLFAAGGSVLTYSGVVPEVAYLIKKTHSTSIAIVAYGIAASSDSCQAAETGLKKAGYNVSYVDLNVAYPGSTVATDVQRMREAGANLVISCMDVTGNITMARAILQSGVKIKQIWFNGNDQATLDKYPSLMSGVYFDIEHVPFSAPTKYYPGLKTYLSVMNKYEPDYTYDEVAIQGWQSASLFAQGLAAAGKNPTWGSVVNATNQLTAFTAGGLTSPVNWALGGHVYYYTATDCAAYIQVQGTKFVSVFGQGHQVFVCLGPQIKNPKVVPSLPGTPGT